MAKNEPTLTVEARIPTPVLIRGVERRAKIATDRNADDGRPNGLYGNQFAAADVAAIENATTVISPPSISNLIAMAAPQGGDGKYEWDDVQNILTTAYTGFLAARLEAQMEMGPEANTVIHTGFWGCGAFGGNRVLMTLLQMVAAHLAEVDILIFHAFDSAGIKALFDANAIYGREICPPDSTDSKTIKEEHSKGFLKSLLSRKPADAGPNKVSDLINRIVAMGFQWGVSDGN
jgi:hypothetical protein